MEPSFSFENFSRECRRRSLSVTLQPEISLRALYRNCEVLLDQYHPDRQKFLACMAGCGTCCIINVSILLPEALSIAEYLKTQSKPARDLFEEKLDRIWTRIRGVVDEERLCMHQPCAFLDEKGICAIYPVRPLLCRGITSTDAASCRQVLSSDQASENRQVSMNLFQRELYNSAYMGLSAGLQEKGIDGRGFEITGIVRYLLRNPQCRSDLQSGLRLNWSELA